MLCNAEIPKARIGKRSPKLTIKQVRMGVERIWYRARRGRSSISSLVPFPFLGREEEEVLGLAAATAETRRGASFCWFRRCWRRARGEEGEVEGCPVRTMRWEEAWVVRKEVI